MNQCLKISLSIGLTNGFLDGFVLKNARKLHLEGVAQVVSDDHIKIIVCGLKENIEHFIDTLYKGLDKYKIDNIQLESFMRARDYRGIFRVIA